MRPGGILQIFVAAREGEPMTDVPFVKAIEGAGLEGDRYAKGLGAYSRSKTEKVRHVTLIAIESVREANAELSEPIKLLETRRNIVTSGIDLAPLVGREFKIGNGVVMKGVEICEPCDRPSVLVGKPGFRKAYRGIRGGIRAEVVRGGVIKQGDLIYPGGGDASA